MKKRWVGVLLSCTLIAGLAGVWLLLPHWIGQEIDAQLKDKGLVTQTEIREFGVGGMFVDVQFLSPRELKLPPLQIRWELANLWNEIPFIVDFGPAVAESSVLQIAEGATLHSPNLDVRGVYSGGSLVFSKITAVASVQIHSLAEPKGTPLKLSLSMGPDAGNSPPKLDAKQVWNWRLSMPAQSFSALGYSQLALRSDLDWQGTYRRTDTHEFEIKGSPSMDRWEWKLAPQDTVRVGVSEFSLKAKFGEIFGPFEARAKINGNWRAFAPKGTLQLRGDSLENIHGEFQGSTLSRKFRQDKFEFGPGELKHTLRFEINARQLKRLQLSLDAAMDEMIYDNTSVKELSASIRVLCQALAFSELGLARIRRACVLNSLPFKLSVGRVGGQRPLRGLEVELHHAGADYSGSMQAQWQGSPLRSEKLEVSEDFSRIQAFLKVSKLSLFEVLAALDNPKLSGKGQLEASVKLDWSLANGLKIWPALFESIGPGSLRYADPALLDMEGAIDTLGRFQELMARGQQALVLKALEDFHYDTLRAELWRDPKLKMRMEMKLKGGNPSLVKSQPFEINIPIEGDLESLLLNSVFKDFTRRLPKIGN